MGMLDDLMQRLSSGEQPFSGSGGLLSDLYKPGPQFTHGVEKRQPYPSEVMYFGGNPHVAGMAAEDDRVVMNPFSPNSRSEQDMVARNEAARVHMRQGEKPQFAIEPEQQKRFAGYGSPDDIRQTIAARQVSGDPSAGTASPSQVSFANKLREILEGSR